MAIKLLIDSASDLTEKEAKEFNGIRDDCWECGEHTEDFTQYVPTEDQQYDYRSNILIGFPSRYNKERVQATSYWEN